MFEVSHPFLLFDYFRVPFELSSRDDSPPGCAWLRRGDAAAPPRLWWLRSGDETLAGDFRRGEYRVGTLPIFGHVLADSAASCLGQIGGAWQKSLAIEDSSGASIAWIWTADDGSTFLPFDPNEAIRNYWSEGYLTVGSSSVSATAKRVAMRGYYRLRPILPRPAQIAMRRLFSRAQLRARFPRWPIETAVHDLYTMLFRLVGDLAGEPIPHLAVWPHGSSWALVLTHDVESKAGYEVVRSLQVAEASSGYRSSWNFVPERDYDVEDELVQELLAAGFEVGVHGLRHDGLDLDSYSTFQERLPAIQRYARRWHAAGFRSPATHRVWEWMPLLGFDYDSSYTDTAPFEPQSGGCCTWLPYHNGDLIELPITLPQDHTVFEILRRSDEALWMEKARFLRSRGGMALLLTHPDYMLGGLVRDAYMRFLQAFGDDASAWRALPRDVSAWWRRRGASRLERSGDDWRIVGPAASDGAISFWSQGTP